VCITGSKVTEFQGNDRRAAGPREKGVEKKGRALYPTGVVSTPGNEKKKTKGVKPLLRNEDGEQMGKILTAKNCSTRRRYGKGQARSRGSLAKRGKTTSGRDQIMDATNFSGNHCGGTVRVN